MIIILQGGRPFAIPEYYSQAAAVLSTYFPGQTGGQAISDVLFGVFNPGGKVPLSVPYDVGGLPVFYGGKRTARANHYVDSPGNYPLYSFGYGLSYTSFSAHGFKALSSSGEHSSFSDGDTITFIVSVKNDGPVAGSFVAQVYLLNRVSAITKPEKQLVAFQRVYIDSGEDLVVAMELEVDRYLPIVNRKWNWELERGDYTFALLGHSGHDADLGVNATLTCI